MATHETSLLIGTGNASAEPVPTRTGGYVAAGVLTLVFSLGISTVWAVFSPLADAVIAPAKLIPEGSRKPVQHLEGGIVQQVRIMEGDRVEKGAELIRLEDTKPAADIAALSNRLLIARAQEVRLAAEESQAPALNFDADLLGAAVAQKAQSVVDDQAVLFRTRRQALEERLGALEKRKQQLIRQAASLQQEAEAAQRQVPLALQELEDHRKLFAQGYGLKPRLYALERQVEMLNGQIARSFADRAEAEAAIEQTILERNQVLKDFVQGAAQRRLENKQEMFEVSERLKVVRDIFDRGAVRAPETGRIFNLRKYAVGSVVAPGETMLEIVPEASGLIAEARVDPKDIDRIRAGQPATLRFPSHDLTRSTEVDGEVVLVASDRIEDTLMAPGHYIAHVRLAPQAAEILGQQALRPGAPVEVYIVTGSRSALSYLARPLLDNITRSLRQH